MRLLLIGDSVTDCGRARPVGGPDPAGLGDGYVRLLHERLARSRPGWRLLNLGVSGDTVRHLAARWRRDVLELAPDWLSVCIGINDVWRRFDATEDPLAAVPMDEFERVYDDLVGAVRPSLAGLVLVTPFHVQQDRDDPMRVAMDQCGHAVKRLARRHEALLVDAQAIFDRACAATPALELAADRIHPTLAGHALLAAALAETLA